MSLTVSSGFPYYISLTGNNDFKKLFQSVNNFDLLESIDENKASFRYEPGKWSIKQIVGHVTDHERIMTYRATRFSRKDNTPLPGYDQELFVQNSRFDELSYSFLLNDLKKVREATLSLIDSLSESQWQLKGLAWKFELSVEDVLRATIGHEIHHMNVIRDKYLKSPFF